MKTPKLEFVTTRDLQAPLYAGDDDLDYGWQMIPLPPKPDGRGGWRIDPNYDSDRKTRWVRVITV